jgi:hypothetical protein
VCCGGIDVGLMKKINVFNFKRELFDEGLKVSNIFFSVYLSEQAKRQVTSARLEDEMIDDGLFSIGSH